MNHGTRSCYQQHKCRCDDCREANTTYMAQHRDLEQQAAREHYIRIRNQYRDTRISMQDLDAYFTRIDIAPLPDDLDWSWRSNARCALPEYTSDTFFAKRGHNDTTIQAKQICAGCPVVEPCLDFAMRTNAEGVWGGTTETERRQLRKARR
jgi:WhiB family redox-sensing transcriptional regulator